MEYCEVVIRGRLKTSAQDSAIGTNGDKLTGLPPAFSVLTVDCVDTGVLNPCVITFFMWKKGVRVHVVSVWNYGLLLWEDEV